MQCPVCQTSLQLRTQTCSHCSADLTILHSFAKIRKEWKQTTEDLSTRLNGLQTRLDAFETLIVTHLLDQSRSAQSPSASPRITSLPPDSLSNVSSRSESSAAGISNEASSKSAPSQPRPLDFASEPSFNRPTEVQVGQKWLLISGIAITVLGLGFFLKYAFEQHWVGPAGRVVLSYLASAAFLGAGEHFRRKEAKTFGLYLLGGGIAALYLTTFAASQIYDLIGPLPAFGLMTLITTLAATLSLLYDTKWLSVLGLIGGFLTPIVLSTGRDNQLALMSYMTLLNAGILAIAVFKQWTVLNFLGFGFTWLLFSG